MVRNPWDRIRSAYETVVRTGDVRLADPAPVPRALTQERHGVSFAEFVQYVERHPTESIHWMPYADRCFSAATGPTPHFHYDSVIRREDGGLVDTLRAVFEKAGISADVSKFPLPRHAPHTYGQQVIEERRQYYRNATRTEGAAAFADLVAAVGRIYAQDVAAHGYTFGG